MANKFIKLTRMYATPAGDFAVDTAIATQGTMPQWQRLDVGTGAFATEAEAGEAAKRWLLNEPAAAFVMLLPDGRVRSRMPSESAWADEATVADAVTRAARALV